MAGTAGVSRLCGGHRGAVVLRLGGARTEVRHADELGVVLHCLVGEVAHVLARAPLIVQPAERGAVDDLAA